MAETGARKWIIVITAILASLIELIDTSAFKVKFGGEVKNFRPDPIIDGRSIRRLDRFFDCSEVDAFRVSFRHNQLTRSRVATQRRPP